MMRPGVLHARINAAQLIFVLLIFLAGAVVTAQSTQPVRIRISGKVAGWSGSHALHVALWDRDGFLTKPSQQLLIEPGSAPEFEFQIPAGRWAISAYEDVNGNGVLDEGAFGPKEPSGFGRAFHGWHKPRFDEVASDYERDTTGIWLRLSK